MDLEYYLNSIYLDNEIEDVDIDVHSHYILVDGVSILELIDDPSYYLLWLVLTDDKYIGFSETENDIFIYYYMNNVNIPDKQLYTSDQIFDKMIELGYLPDYSVDITDNSPLGVTGLDKSNIQSTDNSEGFLKAALLRRMNRRNVKRLILRRKLNPAEYKRRSAAAKLGWRRNRGRYRMANALRSNSMVNKRRNRIQALLTKNKI